MPPAGSPVRGAVSTRPVVVVDVRSAERLPVRPPSSRAEVTQGVIGVAVVTGHVQSVVVVLRVDGHAVVLGPRPLASVHHVHLHAQATTCSKYIVTTNLSPYIHVLSRIFPRWTTQLSAMCKHQRSFNSAEITTTVSTYRTRNR